MGLERANTRLNTSTPDLKRAGKISDLRRLRFIDRRVVLSDRSDTINRSAREQLSPEEIKKLYSHLRAFLLSGHGVENALRTRWGIPPVVKHIEIEAVCWDGSAASGYKDRIKIEMGRPSEYNEVSTYPQVLYAHELGHVLTDIDEAGHYNKDIFQVVQRSIGQGGKVKRKYLVDIPYNPLFKGLRSSKHIFSLMLSAFELIAHKVELQVCGMDRTRKFVGSSIGEAKHWREDRCYSGGLATVILAREFKLPQWATLRRLAGCGHAQRDGIPVDELLDRMARFFHQVSLKRQF